MYLIAVYGPGSYSSSGSGILKADGSFTIVAQTRPVLPQITMIAFYLCLAALPLGVISFFRKENTGVSLGALLSGLIPVFVMTAGIIVTAIVFFGLAFPLAGLHFYRTMVKRNQQQQIDSK
jgi:hypothetical protein